MIDVSELQSMQADIARERVPYLVRELRQYHDAQEAVRCAAFKGLSTVHSRAADALETLATENAELNALFDLQHIRMAEATQLWRRETGNENISPDLGRLLEWLMERYAQEVIVSESRLSKLAPVVESARDLMRSGYDGPFIGEVCEPLFSALITLEAAHDQA